MAGKKYKPALYELVGKGRVKPDDKGALSTPKWFYGEGESEVQTEPIRREPKVTIHQGPRISPPTVQAEAKEFETTAAKETRPEKEFALQLGKQVRILAPWWAVALAAMGLVLGFLVAYRIGQMTAGSARQATANMGSAGPASPADTPPSEELNNIRGSEVQKDILNPPKPATVAPPVVVRTGSLCLILCGSGKRQDLIDVQEYFTTKGILTQIGRLNDRYVLHTDRGVNSQTSSEAKEIQSQAAKLGAGYNQAKPRTAAVFLPSTFENAYWVNRSAIVPID